MTIFIIYVLYAVLQAVLTLKLIRKHEGVPLDPTYPVFGFGLVLLAPIVTFVLVMVVLASLLLTRSGEK